MALTTPILNQISAFDATDEKIVTFNVVGGDQVTSNKITILNNTTGAQVYENTVSSFKFENTIPANTLLNGTYYSATIITYNSSGQQSNSSNIIQFKCLSQATLTPTNFSSGGTIDSQSYNFIFRYEQVQENVLNSYSISLYNSANISIANSGIKYSTATPPNDISYTFSGLSNGDIYYIQAKGTTVDGMSVVSDYLQVIVKYEIPSAYSQLVLSNNCNGGYITVESHFSVIPGVSNPSPPIYIENKSVDLTIDGSYVSWISGYVIDSDYTLRAWGKNFTSNSIILTQSDSIGNRVLNISYCQGYVQGSSILQTYLTLDVFDGSTVHYSIYSNYITNPLPTEQICVYMRKIKNIYELIIENKGVVS